MTGGTAPRANPVADLRREFDNTFAAPQGGRSAARESLIALRVAGQPFAVRTLQITGVANRRRIVPVPTRVPGLLGIAALRGALLPVYDLAALLGLPAAGSAGAWLLLTSRDTPVGFIFDEFEGRIEIEAACLFASDGSGARKHACLMAEVGAAHRAVIDVPGLVAEIRQRAGVTEPVKE